MNVKFVLKGLLLALPIAILTAAAWLLFQTPLVQPLDPTPPPPSIASPRGSMPAGPVGLEELAQYRGEDYAVVGSGFLLQLPDGQVTGVTTAHSLSFGNPGRPLERVALRVAGQTEPIVEFDTLRGPPGKSFTLPDMTSDYVLLQMPPSLESGPFLAPDPRGGPQPGERLSLYSGQRILQGTVQSAEEQAAWVLMDEWFSPALMSGSPFFSQHTGQVVGMAVAASPRRNRLYLAMHPIGSIVDLAQSATDFSRLDQFGLDEPDR
jgi:hypothetical protein